MATFVSINGVALPTPSFGSGQQTTSTVVDAGRNIDGQVIGQRIGRDLSKLELKWSVLSVASWSQILSIIDSDPMNLSVYYYDQRMGAYVTKTMYAGDRTARPYTITSSGQPSFWVDCVVNLIDKGV